MNTIKTLSFTAANQVEIGMSFYEATEGRKDIAILYFHGGGFLCGTRDDLPQPYIDKFLNAGYDLIAVDYPLAPESSLDTILDACAMSVRHFLSHHADQFGLKSGDYILFGRSAGAYLCLKTCETLILAQDKTPESIISLYGYHDLNLNEFREPCEFYKQYPQITKPAVQNMIEGAPITSAPLHKRFALYVHARQEGAWMDLLNCEHDITDYAVSLDTLSKFPPTILAAATHDPDVPYGASKALHRRLPVSHCITLYEGTHDFDRDCTDTSLKTYDDIISWIDRA